MTHLTYLQEPGPIFRYIAADFHRKGQYLVVYGYAICTTKDFSLLYILSGNVTSKGHSGGTGNQARFGEINGIARSPTSNKHMWVSDHGNNCIRNVNIRSTRAQDLTGNCSETVVRDGKFNSAGVAFPFGLIASPSDRSKLYYYERKTETLRQFIRLGPSWYIRTVFALKEEVYGLNFDPAGAYVYFSTKSNIIRVSSTWDDTAETVISGFGHNDGNLDSAEVRDPKHILFLDKNNFLLADYNNHVLRLVDLDRSVVSTICVPQNSDATPTSGSTETCRMRFPRHLVASTDLSRFYILGDFSSYELQYFGEF